jgi:hypothetical protein
MNKVKDGGGIGGIFPKPGYLRSLSGVLAAAVTPTEHVNMFFVTNTHLQASAAEQERKRKIEHLKVCAYCAF